VEYALRYTRLVQMLKQLACRLDKLFALTIVALHRFGSVVGCQKQLQRVQLENPKTYYCVPHDDIRIREMYALPKVDMR
jgi:hypothetical protein